MVNFSHSQYSFSSSFYQVKTFSICDEKITHLSSVQAKLLKNLFDWFQLGFDFKYSSLKMSGKGIVLSMDFISFLCGNCRWKTSLFRLLSTWIFVFIRRVYREESLSQKKSKICVSSTKKFYLQNNIDFFVCKVNNTQLFSFSWY